ncbi:hypothetical protein C8R46DRAFT_1058807 [Mycena filopes]|nr:hypothetical protein C8R46DRAFT_1058807 [Mycena filopes]
MDAVALKDLHPWALSLEERGVTRSRRFGWSSQWTESQHSNTDSASFRTSEASPLIATMRSLDGTSGVKRSTSSTDLASLAARRTKPRPGPIAGAVVGTLLFLIIIAAMFFFCRRRRRASKPPGDKLSSLERGPDPTAVGRDSAASNLLTGDGQPAPGEGDDAVSTTESKRSLIQTPIAAIAGGIAYGATFASDAVLGLQRRLFKRSGTTGSESTSETGIELEAPAPWTLPRDAVAVPPPAQSTESTPRPGFLAKIAQQVKKHSFKAESSSAVGAVQEGSVDGMTFQERLFKRPTTDSTTEDEGAWAAKVPEGEPPLFSEEPIDMQLEVATVKDDDVEGEDLASPLSVKGSTTAEDAASIRSFRRRIFKRTATETSVTNDLETAPVVVDIVDAPLTSPPVPGAEAIQVKDVALPTFWKLFKRTGTDTTMSSEVDESDSPVMTPPANPSIPEGRASPKPRFMVKLRHKFSKPVVLPDPESAPDPARPSTSSHVAPASEDTDHTTSPSPDSSNAAGLNRRPSNGRVAAIGTSSKLMLVTTSDEPESPPPPFGEDKDQDGSPGPSAGAAPPTPTRSLSTMKRDQTRAVHAGDGGESSSYLAPPSDPPPPLPADLLHPPSSSITRSLSTMKRDQTRVISRDQQHGPRTGLLQLMPGQGRVVSTDGSRAVAAELRDLREYIRVLEADLAAGRGDAAAAVPPPPSYEAN